MQLGCDITGNETNNKQSWKQYYARYVYLPEIDLEFHNFHILNEDNNDQKQNCQDQIRFESYISFF